MKREKVFTVEGYWDGPIAGSADYQAKPYYFDVLEDDAENDEVLHYTITPLTDRIFELITNNWEIWLRWHNAYKKGDTTIDTHPSLPEDRNNYEIAKKEIDGYLFQNRNNAIIRKGKFFMIKDAESLNFAEYEVEWS